MITRHKIVLVGESAPQNRSCGVVVPPQTRSCSGIERKHEHEREGKSINYFFSFYEFEARTRANWMEGGRTRGKSLAARFGAAREGSCSLAFIEGRGPIVGRPWWSDGVPMAPKFLIFGWAHECLPKVPKLIECKHGQADAGLGVAPNEFGLENHPSSCMH